MSWGRGTTERTIGLVMRLLLGVIGVVAIGAGLAVGATELRVAFLGAPLAPSLAAAAVCGVVVAGGATLLRGALRGRIHVRRTAAGRPRQ